MHNDVKKHLPEDSIDLVIQLLNKYPHQLKIVKKRHTKHGDFRLNKDKKYQITINNSLNPHQFLLTLIHEIAHLVTHVKYKRVRPHGNEWKREFQHLMLPFLKPSIYPIEVLPLLANYLKNPKASTDSDAKLAFALKSTQELSEKNFIFEIPFGSDFIFKNRTFRRGKLRRTRYECVEINSKRIYLFNQNAEVELITVTISNE